jgi:hypothetical protein
MARHYEQVAQNAVTTHRRKGLRTCACVCVCVCVICEHTRGAGVACVLRLGQVVGLSRRVRHLPNQGARKCMCMLCLARRFRSC